MTKALIKPSGTRSPERSLDKAWERQFSQLAAFKERHGHCRPSRRVASLSKLVCWIDEQRWEYDHGTLEPDREQRLDDLGFCWELADEIWEINFDNLKVFRKKHGHTNTSITAGVLDTWVREQRTAKSKGRLDSEREALLNSIGFCWNTKAPMWETHFAELLAFKKIHGHASPPVTMEPLGEWASRQRQNRSKGCLDREYERRLNELGFSWNPKLDFWEKHFARLVAFKNEHGHANPPVKAGFLGKWACTLRTLKGKGRLTPERVRRLNAIGFVWNTKVDTWERRFSELVAAQKKQRGYADAIRKSEPLGAWICEQRQFKVKGRLDPKRERRLNAIGFVWNTRDDAWEKHFAKLVAFKKKHGHACPPVDAGSLSTWVHAQRAIEASGRFNPERKRRLNAIGFVWNFKAMVWETRFAELVAFKKKHGHASPPTKVGVLGNWICLQRRLKTNGRLDPKRRRRLDKLGFVWKIKRKCRESIASSSRRPVGSILRA